MQSHSKIIIGQMSGKTQLPLPAAEKKSEGEEPADGGGETDLLVLESSVVDWSHQVRRLPAASRDAFAVVADGRLR